MNTNPKVVVMIDASGKVTSRASNLQNPAVLQIIETHDWDTFEKEMLKVDQERVANKNTIKQSLELLGVTVQ
jgi:hypothetical protein